MKKLTFLLTMLLTLGIGTAWAAEETVTWTASTNALGSKISALNGTATGTIKTGDFVWNYTRTLVSLKSGKTDHVAMSNGYMQLGSSNAGETLQLTTSNIPGTIKSVAVDCWSKDGAHTLTISVGGTSYYSGATPSSGSTKTGTGTSSGAIDISFSISKNNALYIKSITVVYDETSSGGGSTPDPETPAATLTADPTSLDFGTVTQNDDVAAKTFTISGSDLTAGELALTAPSGYTVSPETVAVDGTLANTTVTVTPNTTAVGPFNGNLTITGGGLTSAVNVALSMTVEKAPANPTDNVYVKVTTTAGITDGEYLIVYEDAASTPKAPVAFDGSLATLDAAGNMMSVTITDNVINGNTEIDEVTFNISAMTGGYAIKSKSGKYIGRTSSGNGMNTGASEILNIITITDGKTTISGSGDGASTSLQYYSVSGSERFRYYGSNQKPIALYKKVDPNAVVEPVFTLAAGEYYGTQSVTISCATAGAEVYYTLDGNDPTSASTKYTGAISIASTTTIKAVAIKGENSSAVVSATYTILTPLATMQAIFDKATAVGGTATPVHITMNNWVVTGVKNSNAYVTDGTKGLIIYTASHGFNVGDILSGTVACKVQLYKGSAELTELTATTEGLTVTTGGAVSPREVTDITTLGGVNTGSVIKVTGPCTINGTKYYVAGLELYNSLFAYTNPEAGFNYECTGVYVQFDATQEILPRKAEDLVKIETQQPAGISFAVTEHTAEVGAAEFAEPTLTNPNSLTVTYKTSDETLATVDATTGEVTIGNKEGKVTITASFAGNEDYVEADASYYITITDPSISEATFVAGTDVSDEKSISKNGVTVEFTDGVFNRADNYRCYGNQKMTISYANGQITKIVFTCTGSGTSDNGPGKFTTESGYTYDAKVGTWVGSAKSVTFAASAQVRMTEITVYYKEDTRTAAGLEWSPEAINLTIGDAFTAPTLNNPNNVTGITYDSDNESLAMVNETTGAVTLVPDATGTATITAKFDGNETYKAANVSYTITVKSLPVYGVWELVTGVTSLAAGDKVVIVAKDYDFALSTNQKSNNRGQAAVSKNSDDNTVAFGKDVQVLTLEAGTVDNTFALNTGNGYLYASSSSSNQLKTQAKKDDNASWKISIADGTATIVAQGSNTSNTMQYNQSSSLFACYASASQKAVCLYTKKNVKVEGETDNTSIPNQSDVTVDNAELTVTTEAEYDNMYIGNNGTVDVEETLTVNNLYIQTTMGTTTSGQLNTTPENIIIKGDAFIDITLGKNGDPNQWHAFTVPFPVDAMNGVYDLNDNQLKNEVNYAIMDYHGDIRANGQYGWKKYRGILVPGTFYLMTVDGARTTYRFKKVKDAALVAENTKSLSAYNPGGDKNTDYGWNGVGNPTLMHGKVAFDAQILDPISYTYQLIEASSAHYFTVGTPFFIQAATDGEVTITAEGNGTLAPARRAAAAVENIKVMLGNSDYTDRLYVSASEDATNEYEIGKDLAKMTMTKTPSVPQIFAEAYNTSLCMIDAPMANNEAVVALNLYAPAEGEYTLSVEEQADATVYLLYNGNIVWNLSMSEYPIQLSQGDNAGYSLVVRRENAPTDVENILGADEQTEKFIYNGKLYILHEDKVFNTVGNMLK